MRDGGCRCHVGRRQGVKRGLRDQSLSKIDVVFFLGRRLPAGATTTHPPPPIRSGLTLFRSAPRTTGHTRQRPTKSKRQSRRRCSSNQARVSVCPRRATISAAAADTCLELLLQRDVRRALLRAHAFILSRAYCLCSCAAAAILSASLPPLVPERPPRRPPLPAAEYIDSQKKQSSMKAAGEPVRDAAPAAFFCALGTLSQRITPAAKCHPRLPSPWL